MATVTAAGAPDLLSQFPYAQLGFLSAYTKQKIFQNKRGHIDVTGFYPFLRPSPSA
jgi:hypothetical protein